MEQPTAKDEVPHRKSEDEASHDENPLDGDVAGLADRAAEVRCSPWTKSMFKLYGCLLVTYFCGCLNGYDGSLMGGLNAMKSYQDYFNT